MGAHYSATATLPFAKNELTSDVQGNISGGAGFANPYYMPLILGWSGDRFGARTIYGFLAPTGALLQEEPTTPAQDTGHTLFHQGRLSI